MATLFKGLTEWRGGMVWERSKVPFCLYLLMGNLGISGICENVVLDVVAVSILRKSDMFMDVVVLFLEMSSSLSLFETTMHGG